MKYILILFFGISLLASCKNKQTLKYKREQLEKGQLSEQNVYTSAEVGWKVEIPEEWPLLSKSEKQRLNDKGQRAFEESGYNLDASNLMELINLKKDRFNSFLSTFEPFEEIDGVTYEESNKNLIESIKNTYKDQGIYAEFKEDTEKVDGLTFNTFFAKIYSPDKSKIILYQKGFSRLINGYDFSMVLNYNNETDKQSLENMVYTSRFSIRD